MSDYQNYLDMAYKSEYADKSNSKIPARYPRVYKIGYPSIDAINSETNEKGGEQENG